MMPIEYDLVNHEQFLHKHEITQSDPNTFIAICSTVLTGEHTAAGNLMNQAINNAM